MTKTLMMTPGDVVSSGPRQGMLFSLRLGFGSDTCANIYRDASRYHAFTFSVFRYMDDDTSIYDSPDTYRTVDDAVRAAVRSAR